jgi:hypothetical protein
MRDVTTRVKGAYLSEIAQLMTRKIFLDLCMEIERLCADLYSTYSTMYVEIPETCSFWKKAALGKENLQKQYEILLRLMNEIEFDVSGDSLKRADFIQRKLRKFIDQSKNGRPELWKTFSNAVEIEKDLADMHDHPSLNFREESMQKLSRVLGEAEHDTVNRTI